MRSYRKISRRKPRRTVRKTRRSVRKTRRSVKRTRRSVRRTRRSVKRTRRSVRRTKRTRRSVKRTRRSVKRTRKNQRQTMRQTRRQTRRQTQRRTHRRRRLNIQSGGEEYDGIKLQEVSGKDLTVTITMFFTGAGETYFDQQLLNEVIYNDGVFELLDEEDQKTIFFKYKESPNFGASRMRRRSCARSSGGCASSC
jgi:hypothetical protein